MPRGVWNRNDRFVRRESSSHPCDFFAGKGDVQLAFGWNNAQLQTNARNVAFRSDNRTTYVATCVSMAAEGRRGEQTHSITVTKSTELSSIIEYGVQVRSQIAGYKLNGFGATTVRGPAAKNERVLCISRVAQRPFTKMGSVDYMSASHGTMTPFLIWKDVLW